jgi:hypothetical protein
LPNDAAWRAALSKPHNVEATPLLPRSVARVRAAAYKALDGSSIKRKPVNFRSKRRRK